MTQPFRTGHVYHSTIWEGLHFRMDDDVLHVNFPEPLYSLSSAIMPGGFSMSDGLLNWKVPLDYGGGDPLEHLHARCERAGASRDRTIGFMTAAKLTHASIQEVEGDQFRLVCCATAGTRNAARAGDSRTTYSAYLPGTINIGLFIDAGLTEAAIVGAMITATEAKSAALQELGVIEWESGRIATGTTTDAIAVCVSQQAAWGDPHAYAGSATTIGCAIGEMVYHAVSEAVRTQGER
ncbi:adenosylcobinamide amidohydrolase [Paenibacillus sp. strain BS8-2]